MSDATERPEGTYLVTSRLILRELMEADLADAHAYRSDPEVVRFMLSLEPESLEQTRAWLQAVIAQRQRQPRARNTLAIVLRAEGRVIGQITIGSHPEDFPAEGEVGIGYMLRRDCWGRGYAAEAARALVEFGFGTLGATQVSAWCFEGNVASARVLEKAGMRLALRQADIAPKTGQPIVSLKYAIRRGARGEW